jgi:hypothetical protein
MKIAAIVGTTMLSLLLGTSVPARAQHGEHGGSEKHHGNDDHQKEHGRSNEQHSDKHSANNHEQQREQHSEQRHVESHNNSERQQSYHQQSNRTDHMRVEDRHEHERQVKQRDVWQDHRARNWQHEHHGWHERGGYTGYRIPEDRFRAHFGRGHWFRVRNNPIIVVEGYPRFQYSGFWFSLVDPWPEYWSRTWYETDDVYVDYVNDGYYMYNRRHPGVAIAVNVSF